MSTSWPALPLSKVGLPAEASAKSRRLHARCLGLCAASFSQSFSLLQSFWRQSVSLSRGCWDARRYRCCHQPPRWSSRWLRCSLWCQGADRSSDASFTRVTDLRLRHVPGIGAPWPYICGGYMRECVLAFDFGNVHNRYTQPNAARHIMRLKFKVTRR